MTEELMLDLESLSKATEIAIEYLTPAAMDHLGEYTQAIYDSLLKRDQKGRKEKMTTKNEMLKTLIDNEYRRLTKYKKIYHVEGTLNDYDNYFMTGVISQLQKEIDSLQELLKSYNELDRANANLIRSTCGMK